MPSRRLVLQQIVGSSTALALSPFASAARAAEAYPSQPVKVLIGFPAGGPLDVGTRIVLDRLATGMRATMVPVNKPGAGATLAARQVATSDPDGYSLLLGATANMAIARYLFPSLAYNADTDLRPIAQFAVSQNVIYAQSGSGVTTLKQWLKLLKDEPGKFNYASPGNGTTAHLTMEMLKTKDQLSIVHVPFRGSSAAVNAVIAGDVRFGVDAISGVLGMLQAGRIVPLAQTGKTRHPALPQTPTMEELGYSGMPSGTYLGLVAPAHVPGPVMSLLQTQVRDALKDQTLLTRLADMGLAAEYLDGDQFAATIKSELPFWEKAVQISDAKES